MSKVRTEEHNGIVSEAAKLYEHGGNRRTEGHFLRLLPCPFAA
jgi:hypothetical protein